MKKLLLIFTLSYLSFSGPAFAEEKQAIIHVNGMVCDFCARALEISFKEEEAVDHIVIDLDTKTVTVNFVEGKSLSDEALAFVVTDSGYDVDRVER